MSETRSKTARAAAPGGVAAAGGPRPGLALLVLATAQLMVVLDATIVNVALPHIQRALGFSGHGPGMGGQRLRADLRRAAAARRPGRGPARPPQDVHRRAAAVLRRLPGRRVRRQPGLLAHGPRGAGRRRRAGRPGRAVADHHHLRRGPAAHPGAGRVRRDEHRRRRDRPDRRRPADHLRLLAVGAVRQRAHRRRGRAGRTAGAGRVAAPPRPVRPARRDHRHRRGHRPGLRPDQRRHQPGRRLPLGRCQGHRLARRRRGAARRVRGDRDPQPATPCCRCGCCATATAPAPT